MNLSNHIICPVCSGENFTAKYEATYLYSYEIDSNAPGHKKDKEFLPFLFDNREKVKALQFIECNKCGTQFPCSFNENDEGIDFTILQKAIRSYHVSNPEFLG